MSDQEYSHPEWLDDQFLRNLLEDKLRQDNIVIHGYRVATATSKGENMSSEVFRVGVESSSGEFALILKKRHESDELHSINIPYRLYEKEIRFYEQYLPEIYTILNFVNEKELLAPELFYADVEKEVIVLKDLKADGYAIANSETRVSRKSAEIFLRKLAKLHAASLIYNQMRKGALEKHQLEMFRVDGVFQKVFVSHIVAFVEEVKAWGDEFKAMIPQLEYISENYLELADRLATRKGLNVQLHGDLWFNNFLFKMDPESGEPLDALLIDFQLTCWASLGHDLVYFFYTSLNEADYQNHLPELIEVYYNHLERVLAKLNYKNIPTLEDVKLEVKKCLFHGKL